MNAINLAARCDGICENKKCNKRGNFHKIGVEADIVILPVTNQTDSRPTSGPSDTHIHYNPGIFSPLRTPQLPNCAFIAHL